MRLSLTDINSYDILKITNHATFNDGTIELNGFSNFVNFNFNSGLTTLILIDGDSDNNNIGNLSLNSTILTSLNNLVNSYDISTSTSITDFSIEQESNNLVLKIFQNDFPIVANAIANQTIPEDSLFDFTFNLDTFYDSDVGDSLTYTATLADDSSLPSWLTFTPTTPNFSGTPLNDDVGDITIKITGTDIGNASVSTTFDLSVTNTNDAPTVLNTITDQIATENNSFSYNSYWSLIYIPKAKDK